MTSTTPDDRADDDFTEGKVLSEENDFTEIEALAQQLDEIWARPPTQLPFTVEGTSLGRFQIEGLLGSGAFGVVYAAYDPQLDRRVAIKLPRPEVLLDAEKRERFSVEASLAAALDHPGIVPIYEAELDTPTPHIVSGLCLGPNLAKWLELRLTKQLEPVPWQQAVHCIIQIADAVDYAHGQGVFHRDLKPSNILLMPNETRESDESELAELADYQPRVTDFGLAKLADASIADTRSSLLIGTPLYMAPEQVEGRSVSNLASTDIYSLGVILYELLAGRPPIDGDSYVEVLDKLRNQPPIKLHTLRKDVPHDLGTITMCALAKAPADRYQTAAALAEDLRRCLEGRPILAKPISLGVRTLRWAQRNRALSMTAVASLAVLALFSLVAAAMVLRANTKTGVAMTDSRQNADEATRQAGIAQKSQQKLTQALYREDMVEAAKAWRANEPGQARMLLDRYRLDESTSANALEADPRGFEWNYLDRMTRAPAETLFQAEQALNTVVIAPDGKHFLTAGQESIVRWHRLDTGEVVLALDTEQTEINRINFSPAGKLYVTAGDDGSVKVWQTENHALVSQSSKREDKCFFAVFLDEDRAVFGGELDAIYIYSIESEKVIRELSSDWLRTNGVKVLDVAASFDHSLLWTTQFKFHSREPGGIYEWDLVSGKSRRILTVPGIERLLYDSKQQLLFAMSTRGMLYVVSAETGKHLATLHHANRFESIALSKDGHWLAAGDRVGQINLWELGSTLEKKSFEHPDRNWQVHEGKVYDLQFTPDNRELLSVSRDGTVRRLHLKRSSQDFDEITALRNCYGQAIPDSSLFLCHNPLSVLDLSAGQVVTELSSDAYSVACYDPNRQLVAASSDSHTGVWQLPSGMATESHSFPRRRIRNIAWMPDGQQLLVNEYLSEGNGLTLFNLNEGVTKRTFLSSPGVWAYRCLEGNAVVSTSTIGTQRQILCWDSSTGVIRWKSRPLERLDYATVSPDGKWLVTAQTRVLELYDCQNGNLLYSIPSDFWIKALSFNPTGTTLVFGGSAGKLSLLQAYSGQKLFDLPQLPGRVQSVCFSGDRLLVNVWAEGEMRWYKY